MPRKSCVPVGRYEVHPWHSANFLANPYGLLAAGVVLAGAIGGAYIKGRSDGRAIEIAERATLEEVARESREAALEAAAEAIAKIEVKNVTIRKKLETEIRERPVYRDCFADQRVLDTVNEAITGHHAGPQRMRELPHGDWRAASPGRLAFWRASWPHVLEEQFYLVPFGVHHANVFSPCTDSVSLIDRIASSHAARSVKVAVDVLTACGFPVTMKIKIHPPK